MHIISSKEQVAENENEERGHSELSSALLMTVDGAECIDEGTNPGKSKL